MPIIIFLLILAVLSLTLFKLSRVYKMQINFFTEGLNYGFAFTDLFALWKSATLCELEDPISIFISLNSLSKCISQIKTQAELEGNKKLETLVSRLYSFRGKIEKDSDKKRGLDSSRGLANGQKLRIILPGKGVFSSSIVNNEKQLTVYLPTRDDKIVIEGENWVGHTVNVYLWRTGDAQYVFDSSVLGVGSVVGKPCLFLSHSDKLLRTQKRNAIRAKCHIKAELYILQKDDVDYNKVETKPGYRSILEDISSTGALIKIGGKGIIDLKLRLQYHIFDKLVVMFGVVRSVQYDEATNISKLHFQCIHIEEGMKNQVLSYVYNILPESEKEIITAMKEASEDESADMGIASSGNESGTGDTNTQEEGNSEVQGEETGADVIKKLDDDDALPDLEEL